MTDPSEHVDNCFDSYVAELTEFCALPSWSANPAGMRTTAEWLCRKLASLGFAAECIERAESFPLVWARRAGPSQRRVVCFDHYEIADHATGLPPGDLLTGLQPTVKDGRLYCRGVADDKGTLLARVHAVEALLATRGELPCEVAFLLEGKPHVADATLPPYVERLVKPLEPDLILWETGPIDERERPTVSLGAKGFLYTEIIAHGSAVQLPSRLNIFPNPAWDLTWGLASLKDRQERVLVEGFYDAVRPFNAEEQRLLDQIDTSDLSRALQQSELDGFLLGEQDRAVVQRLYGEPGVTICGLESGDTQFSRARAAQRVYGQPMVVKPNSTGMSQKYLFRPAPTAGIGVEYWGSHPEQPDEHIRLEDYRQGIKQVIATLQEAATV